MLSKRSLVRLPSFVLAVALASVSTAGCSPTSPSSIDNRFGITVDGQRFQASQDGMGAIAVEDVLTLTGTVCGDGSQWQVLIKGVGATAETYEVARGATASYANASGAYWDTGGAGRSDGTGSVTIHSISESRTSGSFLFVLVPGVNNPSTETSVFEGSFDLAISEGYVRC